MSTRSRAAVGSALLVALLTACGSPDGSGDVHDESREASGPALVDDPDDAGDPRALPEGWRWESFRGVQVGVPGDWGWDNGSQRLGQWCVARGSRAAAVGRPGASTLVGCSSKADGADPATLVEHTGTLVAFDQALGDEVDGAREGDQEVRVLGDVVVHVNVRDASLRQRILDTIHRTDVDVHDCSSRLTDHPADRPAEPRDVATLTSVTTVSACRYALPTPVGRQRGLSLVSSLELDGAAAAAVVAGMAQAPVGGGPDDPGSCLPEWSYGDELILVLVESAEGRSEVRVHYSGCDHNGIDDGVTVRKLTREAVRPLLQDANAIFGFDGRGKNSILTVG